MERGGEEWRDSAYELKHPLTIHQYCEQAVIQWL